MIMKFASHLVRRWVGLACGFCVSLITIAAGCLKGADPDEFARWLMAWTLLPRWGVWPLAVAVPLVEVGLAAAWLIGPSRRVAAYLLFVFFTLVTAAAWVQSRAAPLPTCKCFGELGVHIRLLSDAGLMSFRGMLLAGLAAVAWLCERTRAPAAHRTPSPSQNPALLSGARGFTLIETLVTALLVGIVIAILLPAIASMRASARSAGSLSNLRQNGVVLASYSNDAKGAFLYYSDPVSGFTTLRISGQSVDLPYFWAGELWHYPLANYCGLSPSAEVFFPPSWRTAPNADNPWLTPYIFPCKFTAEPMYWNPRTRRGGRSQLRGTNAAQVTHPAHNIMLMSWWPVSERLVNAEQRQPGINTEACFCDGSAALVAISDITDGYPTGDGDCVPDITHSTEWPVGLHTIDGVSGRDTGRPR